VYSIPLHRGFRGRDKSTISTHTEKENSFLFLGFITKIYVDIAQSVHCTSTKAYKKFMKCHVHMVHWGLIQNIAALLHHIL
jgi:hypothetical protein